MFTKIFNREVLKYLVIITIGMIFAYIISTFSTSQDNLSTTREALHGHDSASLEVLKFNIKKEKQYEEMEYDFTRKVEVAKEENLEFEDYTLTNEELFNQNLIDMDRINRIVFIIIIAGVVLALFYVKRGKRWKSMEM